MSTDAIVIPERATVESAQEMIATARSFDGSGTFLVDASNVSAIDGPAVLAIVSIVQSLNGKGATVAIKNPTSAFVDAFTDLGLYDEFTQMELQQ